jgi:hypothetical protein
MVRLRLAQSVRRWFVMVKSLRVVLAVVVAALAISAVAAFAAPAGAHVQADAKKAGTWCGGTRWQLMTLSDRGGSRVRWSSVPTSIPAISKMPAPSRFVASRSSSYERQVWGLTAVIERYRLASNGELVFELYDVPSGMYMNAYMPNPQCVASTAHSRSAMLSARAAFTKACPKATPAWQMLGATAHLRGVGFWNPVKTTLGALGNGAELRPITNFVLAQGCGKF